MLSNMYTVLIRRIIVFIYKRLIVQHSAPSLFSANDKLVSAAVASSSSSAYVHLGLCTILSTIDLTCTHVF